MFMQINNFISMFEEVDLSRHLLHLHVKYYKVYYIMNAFFFVILHIMLVLYIINTPFD